MDVGALYAGAARGLRRRVCARCSRAVAAGRTRPRESATGRRRLSAEACSPSRVALISPIAWASEILFSVHMTQHEILMLVSAPLLVFGHPLMAVLWAVPRRTREAWGRWSQTPASRPDVASADLGRSRFPAARRGAVDLAYPLAVRGCAPSRRHPRARASELRRHGGALLVEHGARALRPDRLRRGCALRLPDRGPQQHPRCAHDHRAGGLVSLVLLRRNLWHVNALEDQQLAGLLMWVPSGVIFIVFGLALFAAWLGESERRVTLGSVPMRAAVARDSGPAS